MTHTTQTQTASGPYWDEVITEDKARFRAKIAGLHCSLCTGTLEKALGRQPGVDKVAVSLTHEQALVEYDPRRLGPQELMDTLRDIGYRISDPRKLRPFEEEEADLVREGRRLLAASACSLVALALTARAGHLWSLAVPSVVGGLLVVVAFLILKVRSTGVALAVTGGFGAVMATLLVARAEGVATGAIPWVAGSLALLVVFGVAPHFLVMAAQSLRRGILNQHVLLEFGAAAGIAGGVIGLAARPAHYPTAAFFAVAVLIVNYHTFSEWLSLLVKTRSSQAVKRLLDLQPETARVVRDGTEREVDVTEVALGDLVRVRPGERIPVDGDVVAGHSAVDQAFVTGEPIPVEKAEGDQVIGGSINGSGTLLVRASAVGEGSFLAQVVRQIEDARALKPGILHLVDRVLRVYTPFVLTAAALAALAWTVVGHGERGIFAGLSVLVMGYPCAVGIAAPLAIVRGAGEAADQGILMRTGEAFQSFRLVRRVVLDKTGTLTEGRPTVTEVEALESKEELLAVAAAAEASSEHPLAQAVLDAALAAGAPLLAISDFDSHTGRGVVATVDGSRVLVGRPRFLAEEGVDLGPLEGRLAELEEAGRTVIAVSRDGRALGVIAFADRLRDDAAEAVAGLRRAGLTPVLVTGDNARAAGRVAAEVGIEEVHAGVLPGDKAEIVRALQQGRTKVAMVGDGINDAPALMQADVGVAMGAGTDIAIESADVIIVGNRLASVLRAREISRRSYGKTRQNVTLAFLFNGIGIPAAATGLIYPVWAMVAMAASVTTIFVNSLWGRAELLFDAISSVGRPLPAAKEATAASL